MPTDTRRGCICLTGHAEWRASAGWRAQVRQCYCYAKSPERIVLEEGGDFEGNLLYFVPPGTYMQVLAVENSKGCTSVQVRYHHPCLPWLGTMQPEAWVILWLARDATSEIDVPASLKDTGVGVLPAMEVSREVAIDAVDRMFNSDLPGILARASPPVRPAAPAAPFAGSRWACCFEFLGGVAALTRGGSALAAPRPAQAFPPPAPAAQVPAASPAGFKAPPPSYREAKPPPPIKALPIKNFRALPYKAPPKYQAPATTTETTTKTTTTTYVRTYSNFDEDDDNEDYVRTCVRTSS